MGKALFKTEAETFEALMTACHALVQRILLEVAGIIPRDLGTSAVGVVMDPPANLDICPMFADDGVIAGMADEVLRTLAH